MSEKRQHRDRTPSKGQQRTEEELALQRLRVKLGTVLSRLPEVERNVLEARMGLVDGEPQKPGQVAKRLGMSVPEVKKVEARAFERIREVGPLKGLEKFLKT